jgi:hypothetical protein
MSRVDIENRGLPDGSAGTGLEPTDNPVPQMSDYETLRETLEMILAGINLLPPERLRS